MNDRRVGLWFIGAWGGVASTVALGLSALRRGLSDTVGMVTAARDFQEIDLDQPAGFVVGGHDIRKTTYVQAVRELHERSNLFDTALIECCKPDLEAWDANVRPGTVLGAGETIARLAEMPEAQRADTPRQVVERIQVDLRDFKTRNKLDQVVVVNVASTEPPFEPDERFESVASFRASLERKAAGSPPHPQPLSPAGARGADGVPPHLSTVGARGDVPASALYGWAVLDLGWPFVNFTPSLGASFPAALELAREKKAPTCGKDGKTGETMMKSVLAPMFALRNLKILSWVGHNIFGNRDGLVLDDPANKLSKIRTKDQLIQQIVGYKPQTHVSIEYIESLDDWKTAWDHIHFKGFLGTKMILQFLWQGCDSILAAPLVLDLARLALLAQRRGEAGIMKHVACFFKSPMGVEEHDLFKQFAMLEDYVRRQCAHPPRECPS